MLKWVYLVFILGLFAPRVSAQQFRHFPDSTSWTVSSWEWDVGICQAEYAWSYSFGDTTTISGKSYRTVNTEGYLVNGDPCWGWSPQNPQWLREDTILDKVFILFDNDTTEYVLFNYSAGIGDTISSLSGMESIVDSKDMVVINNKTHRRWYFSNGGIGGLKFVIEGIGSTFGLFEPLGNGIDFGWELICVKDSVGLLYQTLSSNQYLCDWQDLVPTVSESRKPIVEVYPNPTTGLIRIQSNIQFNQILIINMVGEVVFRQYVSIGEAIDLSRVSSGVYSLKIQEDEIIFHDQKLVIIE